MMPGKKRLKRKLIKNFKRHCEEVYMDAEET